MTTALRLVSVLAGTIALIAPSVLAGGDPERELVDKMDAYYQGVFADLAMAEGGMFGTSRVELSKIMAHTRNGGDPSYGNKAYGSTVSLYGNHGQKLSADTLEHRYSRMPNHSDVSSGKRDPKAFDRLVADAARKANAGKSGPFVANMSGWRIDVRPVRLSKPECLSCHKGLKKGDAVALMVYSTRRIDPKPQAPGK